MPFTDVSTGQSDKGIRKKIPITDYSFCQVDLKKQIKNTSYDGFIVCQLGQHNKI